MKKITIPLNNQKVEFSIDKYKIFYGNNYLKKYEIIRTIKNFFSASNSDRNSQLNKNILVDDMLINKKDWLFFEVNQNFDLDEDLKLGSKSLLLKYLEVKTINIDYDDNFITLKTIMDDFDINYFIDNVNYHRDNIELKFSFDEITMKKLTKLISTRIVVNNQPASMFDLSYHQIIKLQLDIINEIAENTNKMILICIDAFIDDKVIEDVDKLCNGNLHLILFSNEKHSVKNINDYFTVYSNTIDLYDEVSIYENIINNLSYYVENKEQLSSIMVELINKNYNYNTIELEKIL